MELASRNGPERQAWKKGQREARIARCRYQVRFWLWTVQSEKAREVKRVLL